MRAWKFTEHREYLMEKLSADGSRTGLRKKLAAEIELYTTFVLQP